jgi:phage virion morphogenesis protein
MNKSLNDALAQLDAGGNIDLTKPLRATARLMEDEARNTFRAETDPWGQPWKPHAEATKVARKRAGNTRTSLLVDSGEMYDGIESTSNDTSATVTIPAPAEVHQFGTTTAGLHRNVSIPPRPMFPMHSEGPADVPSGYLDRVTAPLIDAVMKALK